MIWCINRICILIGLEIATSKMAPLYIHLEHIYIVYIEADIYTDCNLSKTYKKKQRKQWKEKPTKKIPQKKTK